MGKLYIIGIGPGGILHMTLKAKSAIEESNIIIGYNKYIDFIKPMLDGKEIFSNGMKGELDRCKKALELSKDNVVSIISTGDSGIYGMAGLILELKKDEEIEIIPGITAASAAGALLGAPLMHDNCNISLSDLMTPYELIKKRVTLAAEGDFIISFYNPKSKGRPYYLRECLDLISEYRSGETPVGIVKNAYRDGQDVKLCTLNSFDENDADMFSIVIIGNSQTYIKQDLMITPRGYNIKSK